MSYPATTTSSTGRIAPERWSFSFRNGGRFPSGTVVFFSPEWWSFSAGIRTIIVAGHSRGLALDRLLRSIEQAEFPDDGVKIIISLDGGGPDAVRLVAEEFQARFQRGNVDVVVHEKNMGLRQHILWCGDQSIQYGAVIVLEDDLLVDPQFYRYASAASQQYENEPQITGVALYAPRHNDYANLPFEPLDNGSSGYFMQVPCSWGQVWTRHQWELFRSWHKSSTKMSIESLLGLPEKVKKWPESSWKKYYAAYMVECGLYFFYPYRAYSTNCCDPGGVHIKKKVSTLQVAMPARCRAQDQYIFLPFSTDLAAYDAFMESQSKELFENLGLDADEVEVDFYGLKPVEMLQRKPWAITSKQAVTVAKSYSLMFKPFEKLPLSEVVGHCDPGIRLARTENMKKRGTGSFFMLAEYLSNFSMKNKRFFIAFITMATATVLSKFFNKKSS